MWRWQPIASMVTMAPSIAIMSSSAGMATISFDLSATLTCPSSRRWRAAKAETMWIAAFAVSADDATKKSAGRFERDYTKYLKTGALKGARIGIARDFMGKDAGTDAVVEAAIVTLKNLGAVVIDPIKYPDYILQSKGALYNIVTYAEFKAQIADYLKTSEPQYPKTLDEIVARANDPKTGYRSPEKAVALKYTASVALDLSDPSYIAAKNEARVSTKAAAMALFTKYYLHAIVYQTSRRPPLS